MAVCILWRSSEVSLVISEVCAWIIVGTNAAASGDIYWPFIVFPVHNERMYSSDNPPFLHASTWDAVVEAVMEPVNQLASECILACMVAAISPTFLVTFFAKPLRKDSGFASWAMVTSVSPTYSDNSNSHFTKSINSSFELFIKFVISLAYLLRIPTFASTARRYLRFLRRRFGSGRVIAMGASCNHPASDFGL